MAPTLPAIPSHIREAIHTLIRDYETRSSSNPDIQSGRIPSLLRDWLNRSGAFYTRTLAEALDELEPKPAPSSENYREMRLDDVEKAHVLATLDHTGWNKSRTAQILGIERSTLDRKLKAWNVA